MSTRVVGIDLSLSSTGIATGDETTTHGHSLPKDADIRARAERIVWITEECRLVSTKADIVVIEGFSFGSPQGATEAGGLGWQVRLMLLDERVPFAIVPPSTLKKFATGKGNAGKDDMKLAAQSRLGLTFTGNGSGDRCDARWLQEMGLHHLGAPTVDLPAVNLEALTKVAWPT